MVAVERVQLAPVRASPGCKKYWFNLRKILPIILTEVLMYRNIAGFAAVVGGQPGRIWGCCANLQREGAGYLFTSQKLSQLCYNLGDSLVGQCIFHFVEPYSAPRGEASRPVLGALAVAPESGAQPVQRCHPCGVGSTDPAHAGQHRVGY